MDRSSRWFLAEAAALAALPLAGARDRVWNWRYPQFMAGLLSREADGRELERRRRLEREDERRWQLELEDEQ